MVVTRYIHYLDCYDGFMGVYIYQTYQDVWLKFVQFIVFQSCLSKAVFKKKCNNGLVAIEFNNNNMFPISQKQWPRRNMEFLLKTKLWYQVEDKILQME